MNLLYYYGCPILIVIFVAKDWPQLKSYKPIERVISLGLYLLSFGLFIYTAIAVS